MRVRHLSRYTFLKPDEDEPDQSRNRPFAEWKQRYGWVLILIAGGLILGLYPIKSHGEELLAAVPPCDYHALTKEHHRAFWLFQDFAGKPDHPKHIKAAHRLGDAYGKLKSCERQIDAWDAPMDRKRSALGLPQEKGRLTAQK